jgi:putative ABC transport system permease protein
MENTIEPYIHRFKTPDIQFGYISIRLEPNSSAKTAAAIESVWRDFSGDDPMQYYYMEEDIDSMYQEERQSAQLAIIFAILALFVASIGLFGLTTFTLQQRTREIGARIAMGATLADIYYLISKDILVLVSISTILAWPAIYFVAKRWLESYYYKINLSPLVFLYGFLIALVLALITISYRTIKTARMSPVISLKYE